MSRVTTGMREQDKSVFSTVAMQLKVWILVRGTNKASLKYVGQPGFAPKPVDCKPKTADTGGVSLAGLVVDPTVAPEAFSQGEKRTTALETWKKFTERGLAAGYTIDQDGPRRGCLRKNGLYLHGDYDLYDVVDPGDPTAMTRYLKIENGTEVVYTGRSLNAKKALNAMLPIPMIQHGDQIAYADEHTSELIIGFSPDGGQVIAYPFRAGSTASIAGIYARIFAGRVVA